MKRLTKPTLAVSLSFILLGCSNDNSESLPVRDDASQPGGGVFIVQNSWGTGCGYKGYFYIPYSVLRSKTIVSSGSLYVAII